MKKVILATAFSGLMMGTITNAAVVAVGVDTTANANWRTAAALEGDAEYGTDGYVLYGINEADGVYTSPFDTTIANSASQFMLPSVITSIAAPVAAMWSGNGNFGQIEDPANGNSLTSTSLLAGTADGSVYAISRVAGTSFKLTILLAEGDASGIVYTSSVDDGSGAATVTPISLAANGLHYHVYDISAGSSDILVTLGGNNNFGATGFAFDNVVPEPASMMLLGLGSLAIVNRRK